MNRRQRWVLLLVMVACVVQGCTSNSRMNNKYRPVIDKWVEQDKAQPPPRNAIVFIGSSSIRLWDTLHEDFLQYDVIQRGFGGSTFADANLFVDKIVTPYHPRAIVVFEGSNDIAGGKSAEEVFKDYKRFVKLVRHGEKGKLEPSDILFIGITPTESRWEHWPEMRKLNAMVRDHMRSNPTLHYIDTPTPILATAPEPGGPPARELFRDDLLHLSPKGYALWTRIITPQLEAVIPPTKTNAAVSSP